MRSQFLPDWNNLNYWCIGSGGVGDGGDCVATSDHNRCFCARPALLTSRKFPSISCERSGHSRALKNAVKANGHRKEGNDERRRVAASRAAAIGERIKTDWRMQYFRRCGFVFVRMAFVFVPFLSYSTSSTLFSTFFLFGIHRQCTSLAGFSHGFRFLYSSEVIFIFPHFAWPVSSIRHLPRLFDSKCIVTMCFHNFCHCERFFVCFYFCGCRAPFIASLAVVIIFLWSPVFCVCSVLARDGKRNIGDVERPTWRRRWKNLHDD